MCTVRRYDWKFCMDSKVSAWNRDRGSWPSVIDSPRFPTSLFQNFLRFKHQTHTLAGSCKGRSSSDLPPSPIPFYDLSSLHCSDAFIAAKMDLVLGSSMWGRHVDIYFHHTLTETLWQPDRLARKGTSLELVRVLILPILTGTFQVSGLMSCFSWG